MCDIDIDLTHRRPLRLGIALRDRILWDSDVAVERIRGVDLTAVARRCQGMRRDQPDVDVVVDIDVVIAAEARAARAMLNLVDNETADSTLLYVGTPSGLVSLLTDIHALGIADGAFLVPRAAGVLDLIRHDVLPLLHTGLQLPAAIGEAHSA